MMTPLRAAGSAAALVAMLSAGAAAVFAAAHIDITLLYRDPASITNAPVYLGAFSFLGQWLMVAAAALAGLAAACGSRDRAIFAAAAMFSVLLAADDLFMLHEREIPKHLGASEHAVFAAYGALSLLLLAAMAARWGWGRMVIFALAMGFFGASIGVDLLDGLGAAMVWAEDTAKLCGMAVWCLAWGFEARGAVQLRTSV